VPEQKANPSAWQCCKGRCSREATLMLSVILFLHKPPLSAQLSHTSAETTLIQMHAQQQELQRLQKQQQWQSRLLRSHPVPLTRSSRSSTNLGSPHAQSQETTLSSDWLGGPCLRWTE